MKREINQEDLRYKGLPFECCNCGNKPLVDDVIEHNGACGICGDSIITYEEVKHNELDAALRQSNQQNAS